MPILPENKGRYPADWNAIRARILEEAMNWLEKVRKNGYELRRVPEAQRTAEICLAAVKRDGCALCHVPESLRTAEARLEAVRRDRTAIRHVDDQMFDRWPEAIEKSFVEQG
jgi:hypothetical protein